MTAVPRVTVNVGSAVGLLDVVQGRADDLRPVLAGPVNQLIDELYIKQFATEGAYGGTAWRALSPVTVLARQNRGVGRGGILRSTGRLWASLTKGGNGPDAIKVIDKLSITRGTSVPYARYHQTGWVSRTFIVLDRQGQVIPLYRKVPKRIPARPITPNPLPEDIRRRIETALKNFITNPNSTAIVRAYQQAIGEVS